MRGEGRQTLDLDGGTYWTEVPTLGYKADFRRSGTRDLDAPVKIAYPSYSRNVQVIVLPKDRASRANLQVAPVAATVAGMEYRRTVKNVEGVVTIDATSRALVPEIPHAEAVKAQDRLRELDDDDIGFRLSDSAPVAAAEVTQLIGREPKTASDYIAAAAKLVEKQELAKAIGAADKAIELEPADPSARMLRAHLRLSANDFAGAKADAEAVLKVQPRDVTTRTLLANILRRSGNLNAAYAEALTLSKIDNSAAQIRSGQILLSLNRASEALSAFDRALSYEQDPLTHAYRAGALPVADKQARRKELDAALKLEPSDDESLFAVAQLAGQLGDHDRAVQLLDQAFLRSPDSVEIRHARAIALFQAKKTEAANREFDALAAKDLTAEELNAMCWMKALANVALDRALEECNRSLAKEDSGPAHDSKATVLLRQARFDQAIAEFDLALKDGDLAAAFYGRALAYAAKGDRTRSDADAARAMKLAPGINRMYGHHGLVR